MHIRDVSSSRQILAVIDASSFLQEWMSLLFSARAHKVQTHAIKRYIPRIRKLRKGPPSHLLQC